MLVKGEARQGGGRSWANESDWGEGGTLENKIPSNMALLGGLRQLGGEEVNTVYVCWTKSNLEIA